MFQPKYVGFSTLDVGKQRRLLPPSVDGGIASQSNMVPVVKKFTVIDEQLVIRDLLNALSIRQGEKPGMPQYGTKLWSYLFEPNDTLSIKQIQDEVTRVITLDPRIILNNVVVFSQENGIMVEVELAIQLYNTARQLTFYLDRAAGRIIYLGFNSI